ncbi:alpha/beta hydrolase family protein [Yinghuangia seranimata]|uniref:alpha/beta hydrolase family protein n=1 Tax=Yinghuangia seranimata TaxID=408067 RepID=UPI00248CE160|nr:dienelactone hydrolase family protein [Yinghuangia seranimata]MDI2130725.1 dienelactone hydrolase family protein [Yinghuangia seranimata]
MTTPAPAPPVPPDHPGPYKIGKLEFPFWTGGPGFTLAKISYPAVEDDGWLAHADRSDGPYPAIVLAPATWTGANLYDWFTDYVVRHGYIVFRYFPENIMALDPHMHADTITDALDKLVDVNHDRFNPLRGMVDTSRFGAAGVSLGGAGALIAAARDKRVRAVIGFAPGRNEREPQKYALIDTEVGRLATPVLIMSGQNDRISPGSGVHYHDLVPQGYKTYLEITGGNHVQFLDPSDVDIRLPGLPRDGKPGITFAEQHATANIYATAFFNAALKGQDVCQSYVNGDLCQIALKEGVLCDMRHLTGPLPAPPPPAGVIAAATAAAAAPLAVLGSAAQAGVSLLAGATRGVDALVRGVGRTLRDAAGSFTGRPAP